MKTINYVTVFILCNSCFEIAFTEVCGIWKVLFFFESYIFDFLLTKSMKLLFDFKPNIVFQLK